MPSWSGLGLGGLGTGTQGGPLTPTVGIAANRTQLPTNVANMPTSTTALRKHWSHSRGEIYNLQTVDVGYYLSRSTFLPTAGGAHTIKRYIEYPAGTFHQVKWAAATTFASPGTGVFKSDVILSSVTGLALRIPANTAFWERTVLTSGSATMPVIELPIDSVTLGIDDGTDATDKGNSGSISPTATINTFGCQSIVGKIGSGSAPNILIIGDSLAFGQGDVTNVGALNGSGWIARMCDALGYSYTKWALPGVQANNIATGGGHLTNLTNFIAQVPFSHVIVEAGLNDLSVGSRTSAQILGNLQTIYGAIPAASRIAQTTLTPRSATTDAYATTVNQTAKTDGNMADLTPFNTAVRAGTANVTIILEAADAAMNGRDSNIWSGPFPPVLDGTHPTSAKAAAMAAALSI